MPVTNQISQSIIHIRWKKIQGGGKYRKLPGTSVGKVWGRKTVHTQKLVINKKSTIFVLS